MTTAFGQRPNDGFIPQINQLPGSSGLSNDVTSQLLQSYQNGTDNASVLAGSDGAEPGALAKLFGKDSPLINGLDVFGKLFNTYNSFQALEELTKTGRQNRQAQRLNSNNNARAFNAQIDDRVRSGASQNGVASNQVDSVVRSTNRDRYISGLG